MSAESVKVSRLDTLAIGAGTLCLLHCLALPLLLLLLPALAAVLVIPEALHVALLAFAIPTSLLALWMGLRRHRWWMPMLLVVPGIALMAAGVTLTADERWETLLTVAGTTLLVTGHLLNWRALRRCHGAKP